MPELFYTIQVADRNDLRFEVFEPVLQSALAQGEISEVIIRAHTDGVGSEADNLVLSQRWADDLKDWMIARGVRASVITAEGLGESRPLEAVPDGTPSAANQRIDITIRFGA
jgi:outer membrane protein OmpA-like peptidoglycan-associated protein